MTGISTKTRFLTDGEYGRYWDELGVTREAIARDLTLDDQALVLDVACGWGYYTFQLASCTPSGTVVALDLIPSAFTNMWRKRGDLCAPNNFEPVMADATRLPLRSSIFDLATSFLGMRDIHMVLGEEGVKRAVEELIRTTVEKGRVALAVTPPDLADTKAARIAIDVEGEVFGARSLDSSFYEKIYNRNSVALISAESYCTGLKMTADQAKTELRDGIEIARDVYGRAVADFEAAWERYGPAIERHGYGMYSKINVLLGTKG
jgi:cyclopropane fatty-acyl-phospholipid synthase-like methyltransferase